ncbi:MAG: acetoacetate--CoA ligase [Anaerolineae bacterium]
MSELKEGDLLWQPTAEVIENSNITSYIKWLDENQNITVKDYPELWQWSVDNIGDFWSSLFDYFDLQHSGEPTPALAKQEMPGAEWFPNVTLNYAENLFAKASGEVAFLFAAEDEEIIEITWGELREKTARLAHTLKEMGVGKGDRVVAYMPHIPETAIAFFAVASLGAIWSSCSPDFGSRSVLDRFQQIEPKVLIAVDGYNYGGKQFNRRDVVAELQAGLPTLEKTIVVPHVAADTKGLAHAILLENAYQQAGEASPELTFERVPFDTPMWVLYSSGTTGLPKPIVQGQGGCLLEHVKSTVFHNDLKPEDRFFWYSSTGWMMWNYTIGALLSGCSVVMYNGSPGYPNMSAMWQLANDTDMTYFGTSAAFISACMKAEIHPNQDFDLSKIRAIGSTGSPLTVDGFAWIYENVNKNLALESLSGGTDLCTAFVGGARTLPIYAGEIQGAGLGAKVQAWNDAGEPVLNEVGELVIAEPMPSMPLFFWGDDEMARYKSSYFEMFPGKWRHGDWISFNERGACVIYGRSDSTINRQGIRMGTSEIYQAVESFDEVMDSLIIDLEFVGRESFMPLFIVLRDGVELNDELIKRIRNKLRSDVSPRHLPNEIIEIKEVPYTLSGKKMEVPIRKILLGMDVAKAANTGAMRNPDAVQFFVEYAKKLV